MSASELEELQRQSGLIGEDAGVFSFAEQSLKSWGAFLAVLGTVLTALYYLWLNPDTGFGKIRPAGEYCGPYGEQRILSDRRLSCCTSLLMCVHHPKVLVRRGHVTRCLIHFVLCASPIR